MEKIFMKTRILSILIGLTLMFAACGPKNAVVLLTSALRDKPKTAKGAFKWVKNVKRGQQFKVLEKQKDGEWVKVQLPDGETEGWIQEKYVHLGKKQFISFSDKTKLYDQPDSSSKVQKNLAMGTRALLIKEKGDWVKVNVKWRLDGWVKKGTFQEGVTETASTYEVYLSGIGKCKVEASSTLPDDAGFSYSVKNLFDKNPGTTWQEGESDSGVGQWVEISFPEAVSIGTSIINGFVKKDKKFEKYGAEGDLYVLNNRIKSLKVETFFLNDDSQDQVVEFEDNVRDYQDAGVYNNVVKIKFTIDGVYKGSKWNDSSISEIKIQKM